MPRSDPAAMVWMPSATKKVDPTSSNVADSSAVASVLSPRKIFAIPNRLSITASVKAAPMAMPSQVATMPARRTPSASRRPMAWPTRTVAAMLMPNGTMNRMAATCSAIWCAASAVVLIIPISRPAAPNRPCSSRNEIEIGAPISVSFLLEYGLFGAAGLLMGVISTTALAAHQIALQVAAILFMVPFGISIAATVRVGHAIGRREASGVLRAGMVATWLWVAIGAALTLAVIFSRFGIAAIFLGESTDAAAKLSATLLLVGSTFFIADGIQTIAAGSLRGMNDTRIPLLFATLSYWLIAFPCAWWLAFHTSVSAIGVWIGLSVGTAVYATLLLLRFRLLARKLVFP